MSVSTEENVKSYACDGSTTDFAFPYSIIGTDTSVLKVIIWEDATSTKTELSEGSGDKSYTVSAPNNNFENGCTISTTELDGASYVAYAWPADYTITIERIVPYKQSSEFPIGGLDNVALEQTFDNIEYQIQQLDKRKSIHGPPSDISGINYELPMISARRSKVIACDASGNVISVANVPTSGVTATSFAETLLDDTTALAARGTLGVISGVDVRAFGAVGGGADDTTAIQAAIDSLGAAGGVVFFPIGIWLFTQLTIAQENITLEGCGRLTILRSTYAGSCLTISADYPNLRNLVLDGLNRTAGSIGIHLATNRIDFFEMWGVAVMRFDIGLNNTTGSLLTRWYNVEFRENNYGLDYEPASNGVTEHCWYGGRIYYNRKVGALFKNDGGTIGSLRWYGVDIESNGIDGSGDREGLQLHGVGFSHFHGCRFENNYANHLSIETSNVAPSDIEFIRCPLSTTGAGTGGIDIDTGAGIIFNGCPLSGHTFDCDGGGSVIVKNCREATMTWVDTNKIIRHLASRDATNGFAYYGALAATPMLSTYVLADAKKRLAIYADGQMKWGDGTNTVDMNLKRAAAGVLKTDNTFVPGGAVGTMTGHETFGPGDGNIFIKDPGGAGRNFNPSGTFQALHKVTVVNTADAAETITFDSAALNQAIAQNERGIFVYTGSAWLKIYVGS